MNKKAVSKYSFEINRDLLTPELVDSIHQRLLKRLSTQATQSNSNLTDEKSASLEAPFSRSSFSRSTDN